ncbi:hypothetical protein PInf_015531 [Phytophthora infestans]|nr:hypothetical protein PInf_015509 [Phytophthora infestans]KAI9993449.1 hypothetical protein PInf_015531 [Phytophthora infestans]
MRSFNSGGVCGLNSQAGYLFERSQNALRQRSFGRARGIMGTPLKRSRDQDSDTDEDAQQYPWRRHERSAVMDGFKRMRVSSPTDSPKKEVDSDMTDEEASTPRTTWRTNKAIVPAAPEAGKKRPLVFSAPAAEADFPWKTMRHDDYMAAERPIEIPGDASCRAMVVFNPYQSMPSARSPRVELVEDDKQTETDASESEDEHFVRFEELSEDNDEPVDMDVD